ncbi:MAG: ATPase, type IV secretory pathway VirB11 component like protein [archaeon GW2011_AR5]|nr:MAG: ATPase, type IV secretory pathway VirB11 component like protein [archaeon GW2011_AR5]
MLNKIKKAKSHPALRGALYKKMHHQAPLTPTTRAGQLLATLRKGDETKFKIAPARSFVTVPAPAEMKGGNLVYPLLRPYAYANIRYDNKENTLIYDVIEPRLNEREQFMLNKLHEGLIQIIDVSLGDIKERDKVLNFLEKSVNRLLDEYNFKLTEKEYVKVMYFIFRDLVGLNKIEALMSDPYIEDIGCDGVGIPVYVVHQKFGSVKTNIVYSDIKELREFVTKLAERCDRYISYADPLLDGTLPDGARVQASLASDVTTRGPTYSIRKFKEEPLSPVDMIRLNTASAEMLAYLWFLVENGINILITGGVATGKTSLLNSLAFFILPEAKIVSIEDTRELNLPHENWIPGVARVGFTGTGVGEVTMFELLRESFRQNPDYLIVGEIRGKEAYVMFQGMASGHPSISTMHAGGVEDLMKRLQTKPINLSVGLIESLDMVIVMVHSREKGKSARRVKEIVEIESIDINTGSPLVTKSFVWIPANDVYEYRANSWLLNKVSTEKGIPMNIIIKEIAKRKKFLTWLYENNITNMRELARYTSLYHRSPEKISRLLAGEKLGEDEM